MHIIQRGNNRQACFFREDDNRFYLDCLENQAKRAGCLLRAFVLMTNHVHLLLTEQNAGAAGNATQAREAKEC